MVRHRPLTATFGSSNLSTPANIFVFPLFCFQNFFRAAEVPTNVVICRLILYLENIMEQSIRQIPIIVRNKRANLVNPNEEPLVCGNNDYQLVFDFDEEWANFPVKTAMFVYGDQSVPVVFEGNVCNGIAIEKSNECAIGVFAGDIRTTTGVFLGCVLSIRDLGNPPKAPTPDVYNQIMDLLQKAIQAHTELPVGGHKGDFLKKKSDKDYDTEWAKAVEVLERPKDNQGNYIDAHFFYGLPSSDREDFKGDINEPMLIRGASGRGGDTVVMRDKHGRFMVCDPEFDLKGEDIGYSEIPELLQYYVANKGWVERHFLPILKNSEDRQQVLIQNSDGTFELAVVDENSNAYLLVRRDNAGHIRLPQNFNDANGIVYQTDSTDYGGRQATPRYYVDSKIEELSQSINGVSELLSEVVDGGAF